MHFTSVQFLFAFLPLTLLGHFTLLPRLRNSWLLLASLFFYYQGAASLCWVIGFSVILDYLCGWGQSRTADRSRKLPWLLASLTGNLGLLFYFKYYDFFWSIFGQSAAHPQTAALNLALPIGISFFTFQTISYQVDLYRGKVSHQRNLIDFSLFVCLFPQLVAGPIVRYREIESQLAERHYSVNNLKIGATRFVVGLSKKVLLADPLGLFVTYAFTRDSAHLPLDLAWLGAFVFALQLYFDFSAYSDMAIGIGRILGFTFPENFDYPYMSRSLGEFWRRWHMTLMRWFRDYLYRALRLLPGGKTRKHQTILLTFLFCGLWHGANWTFVIWGLFHGLMLIAERSWYGRIMSRTPVAVQILSTFTLCTFSAAFFRSPTLQASIEYVKALLGMNVEAQHDGMYYLLLNSEFCLLLGLATLFATPLPKLLWERMITVTAPPRETAPVNGSFLNQLAEVSGLLLLLLLSLAAVSATQKTPFVYFQF